MQSLEILPFISIRIITLYIVYGGYSIEATDGKYHIVNHLE